MQVSALRDFILSQGASKNVTVQEWDKIWTMNKKVCVHSCSSLLLKVSEVPGGPACTLLSMCWTACYRFYCSVYHIRKLLSTVSLQLEMPAFSVMEMLLWLPPSPR